MTTSSSTTPADSGSAASASTSAPASQPAPAMFLERQGVRQYVARNSRGAEILIGDGPGRFSPGDLLKLALAGCNAMSSDKRMTDRLGEDFAQVVGISGEYNEDEDRYTTFQVELIQDLSSLSDKDQADLVRRANGAIDRNCTIGHTLSQPVPYTHTFTSEQVSE
ncbi:OsmC family protein [Schaalia sp. ZJ405]|nr:OsmC family protein [Schaalia sp. ZJ405]